MDPLFGGHEHTITARCLANPHGDHSHLPHNLQSSYENSIYYESEDSHGD